MRTRLLYPLLALAAVLGLALAGPAGAADSVVAATIDVTANPTIVGFGEQVPLTISVQANDQIGQNSEYWVVVTTPYGNKFTYNGTQWVNGVHRFGQGPLADFTTVLSTDALAMSGDFTIEVAIDFTVDGVKTAGAIYDTVTIKVNPQVQTAPQILVTVNGQSKPVLTINDTAAIRIQMDPGTYAGTLVEWWVIAAAPNGDKYYYTPSGQWSYNPVGSPSAPVAYNWSALTAADKTIVSPAFDVPGNWSIYFGIDDKNDGQAAMVAYGRATVSVPGTLPTLNLSLYLPTGITNPNMWPGEASNPLQIGLDTTMTDGTYTNLKGELWLIAKAPNGSFYYWSNSAHVWYTNKTPAMSDTIGNIAAAINGLTLAPSPNLEIYGTWTFYLVLDSSQNGNVDLDWYLYDMAYMTVGNNPKVDLYTDGAYSISGGGPYSLTAYVYPGVYGNRYVDFWMVVVSPYGVYYSLKDRAVDAWVTGVDYYLQDLLDSGYFGVVDHSMGPDPVDPSGQHDHWNYLIVDISDKIKEIPGTWTAYFGFDSLNGFLDSNTIYGTAKIRVNL